MWASAVKLPDTGIGVLQREVYPRLADRGMQLVVPPKPPNRALWAVLSFGRIIGRSHSAALLCSAPAPLVVRVPFVTFVYDLRWRRTRGPVARLYRHIDLRRTVARADWIFAISGSTRDELVALFPAAAEKSEVLHLGPGIITDDDNFAEGDLGTVLLTGGATHKRNELVADALALAQPAWAQRFLCVGVSDQTYRALEDAFGPECCERFDMVDQERMRSIFRRAEVYVTASMEEGFGLPMVEALSAGCQVVAIRQRLTEEIMEDAAVLLDDGDADALAKQLEQPDWVPEDVRRVPSRAVLVGPCRRRRGRGAGADRPLGTASIKSVSVADNG